MTLSKPQQRGYSFERKIMDSFKNLYPDAFVHKLIDTHSLGGLLAKLKTQGSPYGEFLIPKQLCDLVTVIDGDTFFIELKSSSNATSFPLANIKSHQLDFAKEIDLAGGSYVFIIEQYIPRNSKAWAIMSSDLIYVVLSYLKGHKSIKWAHMDALDQFVPLPRVPGSMYDITTFFG